MSRPSRFVRIRQQRTARLRKRRSEDRCNDIILYLMDRQSDIENDLDQQDHYAFCRRVVSMAVQGWAEPYVAAFYYHYGRHPKKLIPEWLARTEKDGRLEIPDYDPLSDPLSKIRSFPSRPGPMYQMPVLSWPGQQDSLRNPPQEEHFGESQIPHSIPEGVAGPDSRRLNWCTECGAPVCERSTRLCVQHLERRREAESRRRKRRRVLKTCTQCRNPVCEESRCVCALHLERAREAANRRYERKRLAIGKTVQHDNKAWQARRMHLAISAGFYGS